MSSPFNPLAFQKQSIWDFPLQGAGLGTGTYGLDPGLIQAPQQDAISGLIAGIPTGGTDYLAQGAGGGGGSGLFGSLFENALTTKDANGITTQGWAGPALGAASGLLQGFMGMKQYGLAKQGLEDQRRQFDLNYEAQKTTTNTALEDRQRARVASNSGAYESVGSYLDRNGIK